MKIKRKIMAINMILLLITIPISVAEADNITETQDNSEYLPVELGIIEPNEMINTEQLTLTEEDLVLFEEMLTSLSENIFAMDGWDEIEEFINDFFGDKNPIISMIFKRFFNLRSLRNRAFVISFGKHYDFNIFKRSSLKITKRFSSWHYSPNGYVKGTSIIIRPFSLKTSQILRGNQFGFMSKFTGIYIHHSNRIPAHSYTFFIGTARNIRAFQLPLLNFGS